MVYSGELTVEEEVEASDRELATDEVVLDVRYSATEPEAELVVAEAEVEVADRWEEWGGEECGGEV